MASPDLSPLLALVDFSTVRNAVLAVFAALVVLAVNYKSVMKVLAFVRSKQQEQEFRERFKKEERIRLARQKRAEKSAQYRDWKSSRMGPQMPRGRRRSRGRKW